MVADWGYVFFASNYRGASGSQGADEFGGADVNDVVNAVRVFDQLDFADGERIGMWGHSRGGMMTYLALKETDRIDAAIVGAGPSEWKRALQKRPEMETRVLAECVPAGRPTARPRLRPDQPWNGRTNYPPTSPFCLCMAPQTGALILVTRWRWRSHWSKRSDRFG